MPSLLICTQDAGTSEPPRWMCRIFNLTREALETSFIISAIAHCSRMEHFISTDGKKLVIVQKRYTFKSMWVLVFNYMDEVNRVWCGWLCGKNVGPLYDFHFSDFKRENSAPIFPPILATWCLRLSMTSAWLEACQGVSVLYIMLHIWQ